MLPSASASRATAMPTAKCLLMKFCAPARLSGGGQRLYGGWPRAVGRSTRSAAPRIWSRAWSSEGGAPKEPKEPSAAVLERYRSKLSAKAQQEGVADIGALREAYTDKIAALRRRDAVVEADKADKAETADKTERETQPPAAKASSAAAQVPAGSARGTRPLSSFLDLDKARALPAEELTAVWRLRFAADAQSLCAVIPTATYTAMEAAARARPQFVLPVPHPEQGAEVHFLQWTFDEATRSSTVLFTQLAEFKLRGEFAQPHTTVTHYTDLAGSGSGQAGVVLMQGQVLADRGVSIDSARWLLMCLQRFYGAWTAGAEGDAGARSRQQLLQWFAAGDPQFSLERLMDEVEKLG